MPAAARRRARGRASGRTRRSRRRRDAEHDAEHAADDALRERLADDLADDQALRPAERLQRAELADALADRRERQERREQERGDAAATIESASPRRCERFDASTSEPLIWSATCFALATWAFGNSASIAFCTSPTDELFARADEHDVREALLARERLQLASGR